MKQKFYIGDGVYADIERGMLKLTTEDGWETTNTIFIESRVWDALFDYVRRQNQQAVMEE